MQSVERVGKRIDDLLATAERFRADALKESVETFVHSKEEVWQFLMSSLQTVSSLCSEQSHYYYELKACVDAFREGQPLDLPICIGILKAVSDDIRHGLLGEIRDLIAAEVFNDLLEMAQYLLQGGYHIPAGAIAGAVLEDTLRKICFQHKITWEGDSSISKLSTELYKKNILAKPQFGQVEAWGKLRNQIDHGQFDALRDVDAGAVRRMIDGLRDFIVKHLT
jgi:hypothetical protein